MKNSAVLSRWLFIAPISMFLLAASGVVGIQNGLFNNGNAHWTLSPAGGPPGPKIHSGGTDRGLYLGHDNPTNRDGHSDSSAFQAFQCGEDANRWCTITFMALNDGRDGERVKVTLKSGDRSKVGYIPQRLTNENHVLSIKGCGNNSLRFQMTAGDISKLQSRAVIAQVRSKCTDRDLTNTEGRSGTLYDGDGEPLPRVMN